MPIQIRSELKCICSLQHNSLLQGSIKSSKHFNWDTVWEEFTQVVPTLVTLLQNLLPKADKHVYCWFNMFDLATKMQAHVFVPTYNVSIAV